MEGFKSFIEVARSQEPAARVTYDFKISNFRISGFNYELHESYEFVFQLRILRILRIEFGNFVADYTNGILLLRSGWVRMAV